MLESARRISLFSPYPWSVMPGVHDGNSVIEAYCMFICLACVCLVDGDNQLSRRTIGLFKQVFRLGYVVTSLLTNMAQQKNGFLNKLCPK